MKTFFRLLLLLGSAVTVFAVNPTVTVTAPTDGKIIPVGSSLYLRSTAADTDGFIASVDFYVDGTLVGTVTNAPYNLAYTFATAGTVSIFARARDNSGDTTDSAAVSVSVVPAVGTGPTVAINNPSASDAVITNQRVLIAASASDADGFIPASEGVLFLLDGEPLPVLPLGPPNQQLSTPAEANPDPTPPYVLTWNPGVAKAYDLRAQVTDDKGNIRLSPRFLVTVTSAVPTVAITAPLTGSTVTLGSGVTISASASGASGTTVSRVEFFADGIPLGSDSTSPYTMTWTPVLVRDTPYRLTARVFDSSGSTAVSAPVDVMVVANALPTVSIVTPAENAVAPANVALVITATATDADVGGSIASVAFLANGTSIGAGTPVTGSPGSYRVSWIPTTTGTYAITAVATDNAGGATTSAVRTVTITATGVTPPTVTIALTGGSVNVPLGSSRFVTANAADADGAIERVEFYLDGVLLATDTSSPYILLFTAPDTVGAHQLMARAYDNSGLTADSTPLAIQVGNAIGTLPVVSILTPTAGSFAAVGTVTPITMLASDADGTIAGLQVYANGALLPGAINFTNGVYTLNWIPTVPGLYSLTAIVTDSNGNTVASSTVGVNVTDNTSPAISLSLSPRTAGGGGVASTTLPSGAIRNIVADVNSSAGRATVRVEFFVDGTKVAEDTTEPYTFRYLAPGLPVNEQRHTYVVTVRATDNAGMARDVHQPFTVITQIGVPPMVNLLTPPNGLTTVPNSPVSLAATAVASGGTIASVQFYSNGSPTGINGGNALTAAPYTTSFTPTAPGLYTIDAIATDDRGNTSVSNAAVITVAFATPTIVFTSPNPNATARATPTVPMTLAATATAGAGSSVLLVEFLLDGNQIGADTGAPYSVSWVPTTAQLGEHVLTARVTDTNAQTATSNPITVNVANVVGSPPSVSVSASPIPVGFGLQTASTVNFIANAVATGTGSTLRSVEIYLNDVSIGTASREQTTNLYRLAYDFNRFNFTTVPPTINEQTGAVTYPVRLYAIARDSNNNQTVSTTTNLVINPATSSPPSIQLQALSPTTITSGTQFFMLPNFNDLDGQVTTIQLYTNGSLVSTIQNPQLGTPIAFTTSNTAGRYNLYAVVTDDSGNTAVSSPAIVINVTALNPPTTTITQPADNTTTSVNAPIFLEGTAVNRDTTQVPTLAFIATASRGARTTVTGIRVGTTDTYRAIWTPTVADTYTLTTQASVGSVSATSTTSRRVVVRNVQGLAPSVTISVPGSATTASTSNFTATATDSDGSVVGVEFFVNRNSIGQARKDPLGNTWRLTASFAGLSLGANEVVARATDSSGNVAASPTTNINVTAASSIAPSITITPSNDNPAFNRQIQLRASASDSDGTISTVQYFANATVIGNSSNSGTSYLVNWTPNAAGTYYVWALATDNSGITKVSDFVAVVVRRNNPVLEDAAFILQSYQDIANTTSINPLVFDDLDVQLGSGAMSRADLIMTLVDETGFVPPVNLLAAYWVLMGQWPTPQNYATLLSTARNNLSTAVGNILSSNEYVAKWGVAPTVTLLNNMNSVLTADMFIERLWQGAGLGRPSPLNNLQFRSNNVVSLTLGRGYGPVGLSVAVAEFITNTNLNNTALWHRARAAALFYQLIRPPITTTVDEIAAKVAALSELPDMKAMAESLVKDILYVYRYVTITKHPTSLVVSPRSGALFSVEALGQPPLTYQWLLNGAPIPGATSSVLSLTNVDASRVGTYTAVVTSSVAPPSASDPATLTLTNTPTKLANISTRGVTGDGNITLIGGFIVETANATQTRQMLIRVVGPSLGGAPFNLTGFLADPRLELYRGESLMASNDNWGTQTGGTTAAQIRQAVTRAGAFVLPNNSRDAALLVTLPAGPYTVLAKGQAAGDSGVVLIEVYDVTQGGPAAPKATNVSTRGFVGSGENMLIAGFVVNGEASRRMLIRGVGPTLQRFGLPAGSLVANPQLRLISQSTGDTIATNDDWASGEDEGGLVAAAARTSNAFPLVNGSRDAALLIMLPPGAYTVQLSGVGGSTGIGIVEVYDVDP